MKTPRVHPAYSLEIVGAGAAGTAVTRLLLAAGARDVTVWLDEQVFLAAAHPLAHLAKPASATRLLPEVLDPCVAPAIAVAVKGAIHQAPPTGSMEGRDHA